LDAVSGPYGPLVPDPGAIPIARQRPHPGQAAPTSPWDIFVQFPRPRGGMAVLHAAPTSTIRSLLEDLRQQFQLPHHGGYFNYRGKPLRPQLTLADYGVPNRATFVIFFPLRGGADSSAAGRTEDGGCDLYPDRPGKRKKTTLPPYIRPRGSASGVR
jgi:hypothetical protein